MNEWPNLTLKVHSIWTHTIAFERTENEAKRTIIEWVMVGNSFCKQKDLAVKTCIDMFILPYVPTWKHYGAATMISKWVLN